MNQILDNPEIKEIFKRFRDNNFEIYIVGGAVRDTLLNLPVKDIDFTTNALPEEIEKIFEKTIQTGKAFGTITVCLNGHNYQITTYRKEKDYSNKRHPSELSFSKNLTEDLSRRDFTVNALILTKKGEIKDYYNGLDDLENRIIRTIGDPFDRLNEDQLRKWRVFRFAAQKKFKIDPLTFESVKKNPDTSFISIERIQDEFFQILLSENPYWGGYLLNQTTLLKDLFNRIELDYKTDLNIPFKVIDKFPKDLALRLSTFFLNIDIDNVRKALDNLRVSKELKSQVLNYLKSYELLRNSHFNNNQILIKKILSLLGEESFYNLLELLALTERNKSRYYESLKSEIKKIVKNKEPLLIKDLAVNGKDLKDLGLTGKDIGKALEYLLDRIYIDPSLNTRETLIQIIKNEKTNIALRN